MNSCVVFGCKFWRIAFSYADVFISLSGALIHFREFVLLGVLFIVRHERDPLLFSRVLLTDD